MLSARLSYYFVRVMYITTLIVYALDLGLSTCLLPARRRNPPSVRWLLLGFGWKVYQLHQLSLRFQETRPAPEHTPSTKCPKQFAGFVQI